MAGKIKVVVCAGTACYVMGSSDILLLEESLPADLRDRVEIEGANCLGLCKNGKDRNAPVVTVNGEVVAKATLPLVLQKIREIADAEH